MPWESFSGRSIIHYLKLVILLKFEQVIIKICHFADFEQVIVQICHFADFEQAITKISHFAAFEQVKQYYQQNSFGRNRMPRHCFFFEATTLCHRHSTLASQTYEDLHQLWALPDTGLFFECLGIQFFNSSHVTCRTPCCARGHLHSPREVEDFPRGGSYSKHMPLPTYLAWLQPIYCNF